MSGPIKYFLIIAGALSILSGIYLLVDDSEPMDYISAFFAGAALIVGVYYFDHEQESESDT